MPTTDHEEETVESVYEGIEETIKYVKVQNTKSHYKRTSNKGKVTGSLRIGERNERGYRLFYINQKLKRA